MGAVAIIYSYYKLRRLTERPPTPQNKPVKSAKERTRNASFIEQMQYLK